LIYIALFRETLTPLMRSCLMSGYLMSSICW